MAVKLVGTSLNPFGIGATVTVFADGKEQRQEKDARRKAQAQKSAKKKPTKATEPEPTSDSEQDPELLPAELLEHEFERAPTPPPETGLPHKPSKTKRKKLLLDQAPQDSQAGPVKVRVLDKANKFLAPKAVQRSRDRREHWLQGRPSGKGVKAFERRPMNAGFA